VTLGRYWSAERLSKDFFDTDTKVIFLGAFHALIEGQHLDFSGTKAEMEKGDHEWHRFLDTTKGLSFHNDIVQDAMLTFASSETCEYPHHPF
jgi:hypothetical protein